MKVNLQHDLPATMKPFNKDFRIDCDHLTERAAWIVKENCVDMVAVGATWQPAVLYGDPIPYNTGFLHAQQTLELKRRFFNLEAFRLSSADLRGINWLFALLDGEELVSTWCTIEEALVSRQEWKAAV